MGEALDFHIAVNSYGTGLCHAPQVVAAQIDKHYVFGLFLGVGQELFRQGLVFRLVTAAPPRSGNRGEGKAVFGAANHDFRGGSKNGEAGKTHEKHIGGGIETAHAPVKRKGVAVKRHGKTAGWHNLDGFALAQHFADCGDIALVAVFPWLAPDFRIGGNIGLVGGRLWTFLAAKGKFDQAVIEMVEN